MIPETVLLGVYKVKFVNLAILKAKIITEKAEEEAFFNLFYMFE